MQLSIHTEFLLLHVEQSNGEEIEMNMTNVIGKHVCSSSVECNRTCPWERCAHAFSIPCECQNMQKVWQSINSQCYFDVIYQFFSHVFIDVELDIIPINKSTLVVVED